VCYTDHRRWNVKTIRQLRQERGWTQLELAYRLGVTPLTVQNWEHGRYEPTASKLRKIAETFGISMDDIEIPAPAEGKAAA
jgi:transcriptional regulator with XRE-family HTH domain